MKKVMNLLLIGATVFLFVLLLDRSTVGKAGAVNGLLLCGNTVIATLFPLLTVSIFLIRLFPTALPTMLERKIQSIFHLTGGEFLIWLLSVIGGYPIGAKLLAESVKSGNTEKRRARRMLLYCVNAGPGFVISAVGIGIFGSRQIGWLLWGSVALSDILLMIILRDAPLIKAPTFAARTVRLSTAVTDSVSEAASATLNICAYVILFSAAGAVFRSLTDLPVIIKNLLPIFEVTAGVTQTHNLFQVVFLIAFGGLSVWCQVFSLFHDIGISVIKFAVVRLFHAVLAVGIFRIFLMAFRPTVSVLSNHQSFVGIPFYSSAALGFALFGMTVIFFLSILNKNNGGNLKEDMLQ